MSEAKGSKVQVTKNEIRVRMRHRDGVGFSYRGDMYEPEADGSVLVPPEAVEEIKSHGFVEDTGDMDKADDKVSKSKK